MKDKLKKAFAENPIMVITIGVVAASAVGTLMNGSARLIEASAYAHRASKLK